jgi:hypothetical protein
MNKAFPDNPEYSRVINNADTSMVPRIGDHVVVGYDPVPKVTEVIWDFDKSIVYVIVQ